MRLNLLALTLKTQRPVLLRWLMIVGGGTLALCLLYSLLTRIPAAAGWLGGLQVHTLRPGSTAGWLNILLFEWFLPLGMSLFAIQAGSRLTAADEESGALALLLAGPITRRRLILERLAALLISCAVLAASVLGLLFLWNAAFLGGLPYGKLAQICGNLTMLAFFFGGLAALFGCHFGRVTFSRDLALIMMGLFFLADLLPDFINEIAALRPLSPFYYYAGADPLIHDATSSSALVLAAGTFLLGLAAVLRFDRRDLPI